MSDQRFPGVTGNPWMSSSSEAIRYNENHDEHGQFASGSTVSFAQARENAAALKGKTVTVHYATTGKEHTMRVTKVDTNRLIGRHVTGDAKVAYHPVTGKQAPVGDAAHWGGPFQMDAAKSGDRVDAALLDSGTVHIH